MDVRRESLLKELKAMAEDGYQEFTSALIPGSRPILGVRIPKLRALAKEIAKGDYEAYFQEAGSEYYEEVALRSYVIGYLKLDVEPVMELVKAFIPMIDSWSICDGFCATLKITLKNREILWDFLVPYMKSKEEFEIRFATIMMMNYYLNDTYIHQVLSLFDQVTHEGYYAKMGIAWAVATAYAKEPIATLSYLKTSHLDDWTFNKSIQKMMESNRIGQEDKMMLKVLKRTTKRHMV